MILILMINNIIRAQFSKKKLYFGDDCKQVISETVSMISKIAGITLGPKGRNVLIENDTQAPRITKDGITVVKHIEFIDRFEDTIAILMKKSVDGTNKYAGDGTTTSTLLIGQIVKNATRRVSLGVPIRQIKQGLKIGRDIGIDYLTAVSQKIQTKEELYNVAMISTNHNKVLAELISDTIFKSKTVKVQKSERLDTYVEFYSGVKVERGFPHPDFKNYGDKTVYNYPLILLSKLPITEISSIINALELAKKARKQLFIFSVGISQSILSTLIYNNRKQILQVCAIDFPKAGTKQFDYIDQIARITDAYVFDEYTDKITDVDFKHLGKAVKVESDEFQTWIMGKQKQSNQNAVIYAGGGTEQVAMQIYDKVIDALNSVQSAKKHGVVAGGGVTYWRLADLLETYDGEFKEGVKVLAQSLRYPRKKLVETIDPVLNPLGGTEWQGFDFKTNKLQDMFKCNTIDSALVGKNVLIDSVSLAHLLIDIDVAIVRQSQNVSQLDYKTLASKNTL